MHGSRAQHWKRSLPCSMSDPIGESFPGRSHQKCVLYNDAIVMAYIKKTRRVVNPFWNMTDSTTVRIDPPTRVNRLHVTTTHHPSIKPVHVLNYSLLHGEHWSFKVDGKIHSLSSKLNLIQSLEISSFNLH